MKLSGDVEGDYVVLQRHAGGVLRIAPAQPERRLKVVALKQTSIACPSQWEGVLEDGRVIYARYRWGELSVGLGDGVAEAVRNGMSDDALYADPVSGGLDGYMDLEELKAHLHGLLEFPAGLIVENEHPSNLDPEGLAELLIPPRED